jgi:hypothetical protein
VEVVRDGGVAKSKAVRVHRRGGIVGGLILLSHISPETDAINLSFTQATPTRTRIVHVFDPLSRCRKR